MHTSTGILTIDLAAIQANWHLINKQVKPGTAVSAVIKSNAYGLGAERVGPALYQVGCREFFLATLEEALAARKYLPRDATIYVLAGVRPHAEALCLAAGLTPVLFSLEAVRRWLSACETAGRFGPCALKFNTGMTRLGIDLSEIDELLALAWGAEREQVLLVMSHLACADEPDNPLNTLQLKQFEAVRGLLNKAFPCARFSLANSSGVFLGESWHFDLVRPGAALYGINPQPGQPNPQHQVVHLTLPVLQLRELNQPAGIGYGSEASLEPPACLAVVAGGYADGLHRTIGREMTAHCLGQTVPVVGRISMDSTVFDVSALGERLPEFAEDLYIDILNEMLTVDARASAGGALGYEILTSLGYRYRRDYRFSELPDG